MMNKVWVNMAKRRYYRAFLQEDLLGDWVLVRCWGSLDSQHGRICTELVDSMASGLATFGKIEKQRSTRGYHVLPS
jgi:hypothetical protein